LNGEAVGGEFGHLAAGHVEEAAAVFGDVAGSMALMPRSMGSLQGPVGSGAWTTRRLPSAGK
jgi:hypothetical protein